jgi:heme exporter protein A
MRIACLGRASPIIAVSIAIISAVPRHVGEGRPLQESTMLPTDAAPLLEARALRCERDERLLFSGLDFRLHAGEVLQLAGPNGSGKTTLLRSLAGLSTRVSGELLWCGRPLEDARWEYLRETLYIGHDPAVKTGLSPRENLRWHVALWQRSGACGIDVALGRLGLGRCLDTPAQQLSAGQRRRIALARLLVSPARLWILDEPFTAIDLDGVGQIEELVAGHASGGGAVLLTTHHRLALADVTLRRIDLAEVTPA